MRDSTDGRFPVSPYIPWMALSQTEDHRADAGWDGRAGGAVSVLPERCRQ